MEAERVKRVLLFSALGNAAVSIMKILGGIVSGSTALLADGSDSILNVASAMIAYRFFSQSTEPPDEKHPYGHTRFEAYGSMVILLLMAVTFSFVGFMAIDRFIHGMPERVDPIGIAFAGVSLILNLAVSSLLRIYGRGSQTALTESRHTSFDVAEGMTTLTGVTLGSIFSAYYDLIATIIIMGIAAFFIHETLRELQEQIVDTSPPPEILEAIEEEALRIRGVKGVHSLRARVVGDKIYADLHLEVDPRLSVDEAHALCDQIERAVGARLGGRVDLTIHVEPSSG